MRLSQIGREEKRTVENTEQLMRDLQMSEEARKGTDTKE